MSIVFLYYPPSKKSVRVPPTMSVQGVISLAAEAFSIPEHMHAQISLRYKKSVLDSSMLFRYANIPNNSTVDVLVQSPSSSSSHAVKIAISIMSAALQGAQPLASITESYPSSTSLLSMVESCVTAGKLASDSLSHDTLEVVIVHQQKAFSRPELESHTLQSLGLSGGQSARVQIRLKGTSIESSRMIETITDPVMTSDRDTPFVPSAQSDIIPNNPVDAMDVDESTPIPTVMTTKEALDFLLAHNFDAKSTPAILTIAKYLANVLSNPADPKYRSIKTSNKVFAQKVSCVDGSANLLKAIGFIASESSEVLALPLPSSQADIDSQESTLKMAWDDIVLALNELNVPQEERPTITAPLPPPPVVEPFDPFKSAIVRTAPQPSRTASATEMKLEQINKRRKELEGSPEDVNRETSVQISDTKDTADFSVPSIEEPSELPPMDPEERKVLNRALMKKVASSAAADDGPPLVTKALRDLEKAQNERIYNKTLIRIRFPDKVVLQGFFHPRHSVSDVYSWVNECLANKMTLELYTSPPRTPYSSSDTKTLYELGMVPAALIHVSWKQPSEHVGHGEVKGWYLATELLERADGKQSSRLVSDAGISYPKGSALVDSPPEPMNAYAEHTSASAASDSKPPSSTKAKPAWFKI